MRYERINTTLGDVCLKITDGAHVSPKSVADGKPMASVKDMNRFGIDLDSARHISLSDFEILRNQDCMPEVGDVLIAKDGNTALDTVCNIKAPIDAVILSSIAILRPNPKIVDSDFLKFYLSSISVISYLKNTFISGAAIPRVILRDFKKAEICIPNLQEQKKISSILNILERKILLTIHINKTLESISQAIFKSWFVEFDPVYANEYSKECTDQNRVASGLFPNSFVESELGLIPKGWEVKRLGDIAVRHVEKIKNSLDWKDQHLIDLSRIKSKTLFNINTGLGEELTTSVTKFSKGDILFGAIRPYFHKVSIANLDGVTNTSVLVVRPIVDYYYEYLVNLMFRDSTVDFSVRLSKGTKMPVISWNDLASLKIALPPESIIKKYCELITPFINKGLENSALISSLTETRDTLLPRLIAGKLDLSNIEEQLEGII